MAAICVLVDVAATSVCQGYRSKKHHADEEVQAGSDRSIHKNLRCFADSWPVKQKSQVTKGRLRRQLPCFWGAGSGLQPAPIFQPRVERVAIDIQWLGESRFLQVREAHASE